jgi:hypothetical protein
MKKLLLLFLFTLSLPSILSAQSVDILWQGEGYVPPFYKGRTLWSKQSQVTFLAVPQGLGNASALNYRWSRNGTVLGNISGVGKNTLTFTDSVFSKPVTIQVEIINAGGDPRAEAAITMTPLTPRISIYENNPLYGMMFHRETPNIYLLEEEEVTFTGFPFFFNATRRDDTNLVYRWGGGTSGSSITYRSPEGGAGTAQVSLSVNHVKDFIQTANRSFQVKYGESDE